MSWLQLQFGELQFSDPTSNFGELRLILFAAQSTSSNMYLDLLTRAGLITTLESMLSSYVKMSSHLDQMQLILSSRPSYVASVVDAEVIKNVVDDDAKVNEEVFVVGGTIFSSPGVLLNVEEATHSINNTVVVNENDNTGVQSDILETIRSEEGSLFNCQGDCTTINSCVPIHNFYVPIKREIDTKNLVTREQSHISQAYSTSCVCPASSLRDVEKYAPVIGPLNVAPGVHNYHLAAMFSDANQLLGNGIVPSYEEDKGGTLSNIAPESISNILNSCANLYASIALLDASSNMVSKLVL